MKRPDFLKVGAFVKGIGFVGRIVDITESGNSIMVRVESAKAIRLFQRPDVLDYTLAPQLWEPATLEDFIRDADSERQRATGNLEGLSAFVEATLAAQP